MRRFFQSTAPSEDGMIRLEGPEANHAARVIRLAEGDAATVLDGAGHQHHCRVIKVDRREVLLRVETTRSVSRPPYRIRLVQALTKGKSFDLILQKAVELGVDEIVPLISQHVVARPDEREHADKTDKWRQTAIEAVKQCGSAWLPVIGRPMGFPEALKSDAATELRLCASLCDGAVHPRTIISEFVVRHGRLPASVSLWIGPEGDFDGAEYEAMEREQIRSLTLGDHVLRSETAALCGIAVLNYELSSPRD